MSALISPLGPTVKLPLARLSLPSRWPSMKRSSLPVTSPLMQIPWLMQAGARGETGSAELISRGAVEAAPEETAGSAAVEFSGTRRLFTSSLFHMAHLDEGLYSAKSLFVGWLGVRDLGKGEDSTALTRCKGKYCTADVGCVRTGYTIS